MEPDAGKSEVMACDWHDFYVEATEAIPPNALKPLGKDVTLWMFVDSDRPMLKKWICYFPQPWYE